MLCQIPATQSAPLTSEALPSPPCKVHTSPQAKLTQLSSQLPSYGPSSLPSSSTYSHPRACTIYTWRSQGLSWQLSAQQCTPGAPSFNSVPTSSVRTMQRWPLVPGPSFSGHGWFVSCYSHPSQRWFQLLWCWHYCWLCFGLCSFVQFVCWLVLHVVEMVGIRMMIVMTLHMILVAMIQTHTTLQVMTSTASGAWWNHELNIIFAKMVSFG